MMIFKMINNSKLFINYPIIIKIILLNKKEKSLYNMFYK